MFGLKDNALTSQLDQVHEFIKALGQKAGLTDDQIQPLIDRMNVIKEFAVEMESLIEDIETISSSNIGNTIQSQMGEEVLASYLRGVKGVNELSASFKVDDGMLNSMIESTLGILRATKAKVSKEQEL